MSTLDYLDFWLRSIHAFAAETCGGNIDNTELSPAVFIVGTHRDSLHPEPDIREEMVSLPVWHFLLIILCILQVLIQRFVLSDISVY